MAKELQMIKRLRKIRRIKTTLVRIIIGTLEKH